MGLDAAWQELFQEKIEELHKGDNWTLELDNQHQSKLQQGQYFVRAVARFVCTRCNRWWTSAQVHVQFNIKLDKLRRRGSVTMRIYKQECQKCSPSKFEEPTFTSESIDMVLSSLMIRIRKQCYGERDLKYPISQPSSRIQDQPHDRDHYEACREGVCDFKSYDEPLRNQYHRSSSGNPNYNRSTPPKHSADKYESSTSTYPNYKPPPQSPSSHSPNQPETDSVLGLVLLAIGAVLWWLITF